jgi:hypothetical protein
MANIPAPAGTEMAPPEKSGATTNERDRAQRRQAAFVAAARLLVASLSNEELQALLDHLRDAEFRAFDYLEMKIEDALERQKHDFP